MRRRDFIKVSGLAGLAALLGWRGWGKCGIARIRNLSGRGYPGRVIPLDYHKIANPGRWQG